MSNKTTRRWLKSVLAATGTDEFRMPWARGTRRAAMIARRNQSRAPDSLSA